MQNKKKPIKRSTAPGLLIKKFFNELDEALTHFELEQQIDLTEYLTGIVELTQEIERTQDEKLYKENQKRENALFKKFGKALNPFIQKGFNKYFDFNIVLSEKDIYSAEEYNNLPSGTQSLSEKEIKTFLQLCLTGLNFKRNYLYLQKEPEFETVGKGNAGQSIGEIENPDKEATRSRQMLAMYFLLKAGFGTEPRSSNAISEVVRLVHLMTGTRFTNLQNSEIYKKFRQMPNHKTGLALIGDLKFIRTYFADLKIGKALELIDKEIELTAKELSSVDKKKLKGNP